MGVNAELSWMKGIMKKLDNEQAKQKAARQNKKTEKKEKKK